MTQRKLPKLGNTVIDVTTGVNGIAFQYLELITGTVQMAVQPKHDNDTVCSPEQAALPGLNVDIQLLDVINEGIADRVAPAEKDDIQLGNEVEDVTTGMKGIVVTRFTFINGCVYYRFNMKPTKKQAEEGAAPLEVFVSAKLLKVIGPGIAKQMEKHTAAPAEKRPGGPSTKAMRP